MNGANQILPIDSFYVPYFPTLSGKIGIPESLILQFIHYWSTGEKSPMKDEVKWALLSQKEIAIQLSITRPTVYRSIKHLKALDLLILGKYNKYSWNKTNWYRINLDRLFEILGETQMEKINAVIDKHKPKNLILKISQQDISKQNQIDKFVTLFYLLLEEKFNRQVKLSLTAKERGLIKSLLKTLNINNITIANFLSYTFENWEFLVKTLVWEDSKKSRLSAIPTITELGYVYKDILHTMSQTSTPVVEVKSNKEAINKQYEQRRQAYGKNRL